MTLKNPTTRDGYPDFRSVPKPDDDDFDITVTDCGCMKDWCDGTRWSAWVDIGGERWSVTASTHYPYVQVHRDHFQKRKFRPVSLGGDQRGALESAFWRELEKLGYDGEHLTGVGENGMPRGADR